MSYIEKSLSEGEQIKHRFKLHWIPKYVPVILLLVLTIPTGGWALALVALYLLYIWNVEMGVTNKRLILKTGIIGRKTREMKLGAVENVEIKQGAIDRIFRFGQVKVTGRGSSDVSLKSLSNPLDVKRKIESQLGDN